MEVAKENRYTTLTELGAYLQKNFAGKIIHSAVMDIEGGKGRTQDIPAFLFRGESALFARSLTSMQRMKADESLTANDITVLEAISIYVDGEIQSQLGVTGWYSAGYVQHYGLYSELVDFTSDVDICMRFATEPDSANKPGRIAVLDVKIAIQNGIILDLAAHPFARRPRRQKAYGVYSKTNSDIKDSKCIAEMGLTWFEFERNDASHSIRGLDIYNVADDAFAGVLSLIIDDCIQKNGRIPPSTAEILAGRIDRVPLFGVTDEVDKIKKEKLGIKGATAAESGLSDCSWHLAALGELGCVMDAKLEKENSIRKWSIANNKPLADIDYKISQQVFALRILNLSMLNEWEFL